MGSSEEEAQHWLVLDREVRTLSVLPAQEAALLLQQQWSARPALPLQWAALDPIPELLADITAKRGWRAVSVDMVPVSQQRPEQAARLEELLAWLDQQKAQE